MTYLTIMLFALILVSRSVLSGFGEDSVEPSLPVEIDIFHPVIGESPPKKKQEIPGYGIPERFVEDTLQFERWMTQPDEWTIKKIIKPMKK